MSVCVCVGDTAGVRLMGTVWMDFCVSLKPYPVYFGDINSSYGCILAENGLAYSQWCQS